MYQALHEGSPLHQPPQHTSKTVVHQIGTTGCWGRELGTASDTQHSCTMASILWLDPGGPDSMREAPG